jgi:hypothetical protein
MKLLLKTNTMIIIDKAKVYLFIGCLILWYLCTPRKKGEVKPEVKSEVKPEDVKEDKQK